MNPQAGEHAFCYMPYPVADVPHAENVDAPLAGLSFAVKDIFDVAGYPTSWGNPHTLALSGIKQTHAAVVSTLLAAGARFTGKVITDELAYSMTGKNAHFGMPRNGMAPDRIPGGSSSGSASAVSHGLSDFALGTDTGGSVRCPASHCGLIGLRPTHGRISLAGCMPLAPSFDTCGWFARDIDAFKRVGSVLLGADPQPLPGTPRLLIADDVLASLDAQVNEAFGDAIGAIANFTAARSAAAWVLPRQDLFAAARYLQGAECWESHGATITRHGLQLGPGVRERFLWSSQITPAQREAHHEVRQAFTEKFLRLLGQDGVLVLPTMPQVAPLATQGEQELDDYRNQSITLLCLAGLSGTPQISLPLMRLNGVPLGLSLIGPRGSDRSLIDLAARMMA